MILILDYGSQYTELIARRIRELNVYSEVVPHTISVESIKQKKTKGIILSGGPSSVDDTDAPTIDEAIFGLDIPILGICYGMQLIATRLGGNVASSMTREYGASSLDINESSTLFQDIPKNINIWMSHSDSVKDVPSGFRSVASTTTCAVASFENQQKQIYGIQFHPEVSHTDYGKSLIENFVIKICDSPRDWTSDTFIEKSIERIRDEVGSDKVLCALSGGVDSSVVAALLHKAIGDQLTCMFIDTGYMRINEGERIKQVFEDQFKINLEFTSMRKMLFILNWMALLNLKRSVKSLGMNSFEFSNVKFKS